MANPARRIRWAEDVIYNEKNPKARPDRTAVDRSYGVVSNYYKRSKTDRFAEWRRGRHVWSSVERQDAIAAISYPKPGAWDLWNLTGQFDDDARERQWYSDLEAIQADDGDQQAGTTGSQLAIETLGRTLKGTGFDKVKFMGRDDRHLVYRFSTKDMLPNKHYVVVKVDVRTGDTLGPWEERDILNVSDKTRLLKVSATDVRLYSDLAARCMSSKEFC